MAFDIGAAAGGAGEGLEQVLRRLFLEQQQRQQKELAGQQMDVQMRGQDMTADIAKGRTTEDARQFDLGREDAAAAAVKADADRATADAERRIIIGRLTAGNPQLGRLIDARGLGFNINDPHALETDTEHAPHLDAESKRKIDQITAETTARESVQQKFRQPDKPPVKRTQWVRAVGPDKSPVMRLTDMDSGQVIAEMPAGMSAEDLLLKIQSESAARAKGTAQGKQEAAGSTGVLSYLRSLFGGSDEQEPDVSGFEIVKK